LAGGGASGDGRRTWWVWWSGEGWACICLERQGDKVNCTYRGREKDWTKHDAVAALVTRSWPTVWKNSTGQQPCTALYLNDSRCDRPSSESCRDIGCSCWDSDWSSSFLQLLAWTYRDLSYVFCLYVIQGEESIFTFEWPALLFHVVEVPSSNLVQEAGYPAWGLSQRSSAPLRECQDIISIWTLSSTSFSI
jgi:hypothetical protein